MMREDFRFPSIYELALVDCRGYFLRAGYAKPAGGVDLIMADAIPKERACQS